MSSNQKLALDAKNATPIAKTPQIEKTDPAKILYRENLEREVRQSALALAVSRFVQTPSGNNTTQLILDEAKEYGKFILGSESDNS